METERGAGASLRLMNIETERAGQENHRDKAVIQNKDVRFHADL